MKSEQLIDKNRRLLLQGGLVGAATITASGLFVPENALATQPKISTSAKIVIAGAGRQA